MYFRRKIDEQNYAEGQLERFRGVISRVTYLDWDFLIGMDWDRCFLQVAFQADCENWKGRKWPLSPHMTDSEIVQTALKAVLTAIEHEAREHFLYRGKAIFGPHIHVEELWSICDYTDNRKEA